MKPINKDEIAMVRGACLTSAGIAPEFVLKILDSYESMQEEQERAIEVIEFYGSPQNWVAPLYNGKPGADFTKPTYIDNGHIAGKFLSTIQTNKGDV